MIHGSSIDWGGKPMSEQKELNRPDREDLADTIFPFRWFSSNNRDDALDLADQLLALIPDTTSYLSLEEHKARMAKASKDITSDLIEHFETKIEEAKKQERERIFKDIDNAGLIGEHTDSPLHKTGATLLDCPACCWYAYKALKKTEGGS